MHHPVPCPKGKRYLVDARVNNGRWALLVLDGARVGTNSFNGPDNLVRGFIAWDDFTEDDVLAIQPRSDDGGDEELGAIAGRKTRISQLIEYQQCSTLELTCLVRRWPWTA
jgi:hypothetical protein